MAHPSRDFSFVPAGGLNDRLPDLLIQDAQSPSLESVQFRRGFLESAKGYLPRSRRRPGLASLRFALRTASDGRSAGVVIPNNPAFDGLSGNAANPITVECGIVREDFAPSAEEMVVWSWGYRHPEDLSGNAFLTENVALFISATGAVVLKWYDGGGTLRSRTFAGTPIKNGVPYFLSFIADGASGQEIRLHINGGAALTLTGGDLPPWRTNKVAWGVGSTRAWNAEGSGPGAIAFKGRIEEFRVFSTTVTAQTIADFAGKKVLLADHPNKANCVALFPFDDGAGYVVRDLSPLMNHGFVAGPIVQHPCGAGGEGSIPVDGEDTFLQADFRTSDIVRDEWKNSFNGNTDGYAFALGFQLVELPTTGQQILLECASGDVRAVRITIDSSGVLRGEVPYDDAVGPPGIYATVVASNAIKTGSRHFAAVIKAGQNLSIVVDGTVTSLGGTPPIPNPGFDTRAVPTYLRVGGGARAQVQEDRLLFGVPMLVDEIRVYSKAQPVQIFQSGLPTTRRLKPEEIVRDAGPKTVSLTRGTASVEGNAVFNGNVLVGSLLVFGRERTRQVTPTSTTMVPSIEEIVRKGYFVSAITPPSTTLTIATNYEGPTTKSKAVQTTDFIAYWSLEKREQLRDRQTRPTLDRQPAPLVTNVVGTIPVLDDAGAFGHPLKFGLSFRRGGGSAAAPSMPYGAPERAAPMWKGGFMRPAERSPLIGLSMLRLPSKRETHYLAAHHSSLYRFDDRWRKDQPNDQSGFSLLFVEPRDRVVAPTAASPSLTTAFTVEAWIKLHSLEVSQVIAFKGIPGDQDDYHFRFSVRDGKLEFSWTNGSGSQNTAESTEPFCSRGEWVHVAASGTTTATTGSVRLYQNGARVADHTNLGFAPPASSGPIHIGGLSDDWNQIKANHRISYVRISNIALYTTARILPPPIPLAQDGNTTALWALNEGIDVGTREAVSGLLCDIESHPLRFLVGAMGRPEKRTRVPMASLFERAFATNGLEPPVVYDGDRAARSGLLAPAYAPRIRVESRPWWSSQTVNFMTGASPSTRGAVEFYGRNFIHYPVSTLPDVDSSSLDFADLKKTKFYSIMRGRWSATVPGTDILIDFIYRPLAEPEFDDQERWLCGRPTANSDHGNWSVRLIGNGTGWRVAFSWYDSKAGQPVGFRTTNNLFTSLTLWRYVAIYYRFGDGTSNARWIQTELLPGTNIPDAMTPVEGLTLIGTPSIDDSPAEDGSPLFIGGGPFQRREPTPYGSRGQMAMFRYATRLQPQNPSLVTAGDLFNPGDVFDELPENLSPTTMRKNRSRVIFHFGQGKGNLVRNELHFRHDDDRTLTGGTLAEIDTQFLKENHRAEVAVFGELDSLDGPPFVDGEYRVRTTFFDPDLLDESDPSPEAKIEVIFDPKDFPAESTMIVEGLPAASDPRERVHRRIYRTLTDGAELHFAQEVPDSDSGTATLTETAEVVAAGQLLVTGRQPAPIAKAIAATSERIVLGGLKEQGNLLAPSQPLLGSSFDTTDRVLAESPDGNPVEALAEMYGVLTVHKRDALLLGQFTGEGKLSLSRQEIAVGSASAVGIAGAEYVLVYPGEKGIYLWTGSRQVYLGQNIEGTWAAIDQEDLALAYGTFFRPDNAAYFLLRKSADAFPKTLLRVDLVGAGFPHAISEQLELTAIAVVDDEIGNPRLLAGTPDGTIVEVSTGETAGIRAGLDPTTFLAQGTSTVTQIDAPASTFPILGDGPVGARVTVHYADSKRADVFVARVLGQGLQVQPALPTAPGTSDRIVLGRYRRRWRSKRMSAGLLGHELRPYFLILTFDPRRGESMTVRYWRDYNEVAPATEQMVLDEGFVQIGINEIGVGRFVQFEVEREDGPFSIYAVRLMTRETGILG